MSKRKKILELKRKVFDFYGQECVVTGEVATQTHTHHLDEDRTNDSFENLLPLGGSLNGAIEHFKSEKHVVAPNLRHDELDSVARTKYNVGKYPQSYGCNRLAVFLCSNHYDQPDIAMRQAARCLMTVRVIDHIPLAEDTIKRSIITLLGRDAVSAKARIGQYSKALLTLEIGSYFRDYGEITQANRWLDLCEQFLKWRELTSADNTLGQEVGFRLLQHRMILRGATRDFTIESEIPKVDEFAHKYAYEFAPTNDALWRGHLLLNQGKIDEALALLRETEDKYGRISDTTKVVPPRYNHWTFAQLRLLNAATLRSRGRRQDIEAADELHRAGERIFQIYDIAPTLIYPRLPRASSGENLRVRSPSALSKFSLACKEVWDLL